MEQGITEAVKRERLTLIREAAAEMGVTNAALLAGIAKSETELSHCYSEASFASCPGPASPSCNGEPIMAGGADGPCSAMQGGLGMFQFDAGTYAETLATYGAPVLTIEGNTAQAVAFVVDKVILEVDGVADWRAATAWMNRIPLAAGEPLAETWGKLIACRYNGCCSTSATCMTRARRYRDHAIQLYTEMGAAFWDTASRCAGLPEGGIIDQRTDCYVAGGEPRYWRRESTGYGDSREWTSSTMARAPANFGQWRIVVPGPGTYHLDVHVTGGGAKAAKYQIAHAGVVDTVTIDQTTVDGFVSLGAFAFTGEGDEYVLLGDNTGTRDQKVVFDALRVTTPDDIGDDIDGDSDSQGGCGCGSTRAPDAAVAFAVLAFALRRRRQTTQA